MNNWYKLDNAAKLFPATTQGMNTSVFRVSMILDDEINEHVLQIALDKVSKRFPTLLVKISSGVFWNFLNENEERLLVVKEEKHPCSQFDKRGGSRHLLRVLYFKNKISVEIFHALTDGVGCVEFTKTLVYQYLQLQGHVIDSQGLVLLPDDMPAKYEIEDSFSQYFKYSKSKRIKQEKAFRIRGTLFEPNGNNVIHGIVNAPKLNAIAKKSGSTITAYLAAVLIFSIYSEMMKYGVYDEPIKICIPINLRGIFPSKSLRNFVTTIHVGQKVNENTTFEEIIENTNAQIKEEMQKESLHQTVSANVRLEQMLSTRFIPLFIKNIGIKMVSKRVGESIKTMTFTNLGRVLLPPDMARHITCVEAVLYPTKNMPITCALVSVNDKLTITFTRNIVEVGVIRNFFRFLATECDVDAEINSNNWGVGL